jgi:hypothetical protein
MFWILGFVLLFIALMIPILAIVLDSPVARTFVRGGDTAKLDDVVRRIETLETEMSSLEHSLETLRDETQFVQRLLRNPDGSDPQEQPSPPES